MMSFLRFDERSLVSYMGRGNFSSTKVAGSILFFHNLIVIVFKYSLLSLLKGRQTPQANI